MYQLRYMTVADIERVHQIDQLSFPNPWSLRSFTFELENAGSHMLVMNDISAEQTPLIVGYEGFWLFEDEMHISTIATHPDWRKKHLGEVLLAGSLHRAMHLGAVYAVLEVRVSNEPALHLYRKYGFEVVGRRRGYYRDNNEDAFNMTLLNMDKTYAQRLTERLDVLHQLLAWQDDLGQGKPTLLAN